ncbi:MAG: cell division protein FtsA [bacterium]
MDQEEQPMLFSEMRDGYQKVTLGLDIGTTKVIAIIGAIENPDKPMKILGIGQTVSEGLNRGVVVNINKTVNTIKAAIREAEIQAGLKVTEVVCGIAGDHINVEPNHGIVTISNPHHEIKRDDIGRVILDARKMAIKPDRKILHVLPQDYIIDGQDGITDPIGMSGVRLEANVQIITGMETAIQNIVQSVNLAGYRVKNIVLEPLASARAVLSEDEKEVGVALIDIGGGTTDLAIFHDHVMRFTSVIGIAGKMVTDDIRKVIGIVSSEAERIKREYGCAYDKVIRNNYVFQIPGIGGGEPKEIKKSDLCGIIQDRMREIFEMTGQEIINSGLSSKLGAGVVITGGTTLLEGSEQLASDVYGIPVRIGNPYSMNFEGMNKQIENPLYSTAIGLTLYGIYDDMFKEQKVDLDNKYYENDIMQNVAVDETEEKQEKPEKQEKSEKAPKPPKPPKPPKEEGDQLGQKIIGKLGKVFEKL